MKYCEEYAALLDPLVDGALSEEDAARVRAHLTTCDHCRDYVDAALYLRAAFPRVEDTVVPDGFAEGVMAAVRVESRKHKKTPWSKILLPLAACLAVVVALEALPGSVSAPAASPPMVTQRSNDGNITAGDTAAPANGAPDTAFAADEKTTGETAPENEMAPQAPALVAVAPPAKTEAPAPYQASAPQQTAPDAVPPPAVAPSAVPPPAAAPADAPPVLTTTQRVTPWLVLTSAEAGTLLEKLSGQAYQDAALSGTLYALSAEEYAALVTALPETVTPPPAPDTVPVLVLVTP
ncbi:MAG: zf-HC2 domain-containing protein [Oscillibacter sp.]